MKVSELFPDRDAGKTVKMPQRKSESGGIWHGKLKEITEEHGVTPARKGKEGKMLASRKWTKYTVVTDDGTAFCSFSHTDALLARCALEGDEPVPIEWEIDGYGKKILGIGEVPV